MCMLHGYGGGRRGWLDRAGRVNQNVCNEGFGSEIFTAVAFVASTLGKDAGCWFRGGVIINDFCDSGISGLGYPSLDGKRKA